MVTVGLPYTFQGQMRIDELTGSSPYGERQPSANELETAQFQGKYVAIIAARLHP